MIVNWFWWTGFRSQPPIETSEETEPPKKKHRKNKHEGETSQTSQGEESPQKEKRQHKKLSVLPGSSPKKRKHQRQDSDVSLESLDTKSLFADADNDFNTKVQESGVSDKKPKRKRSHSISHDLYLADIKLEPDSDLEKIVGSESWINVISKYVFIILLPPPSWDKNNQKMWPIFMCVWVIKIKSYKAVSLL